MLYFFYFVRAATGAGGGQAWRAGQGWGHAASWGTASPHTVPVAATPRYARRQQSGALGTLQEHGTGTLMTDLSLQHFKVAGWKDCNFHAFFGFGSCPKCHTHFAADVIWTDVCWCAQEMMSYSIGHKTKDQTNAQSNFLILIMYIIVLFL